MKVRLAKPACFALTGRQFLTDGYSVTTVCSEPKMTVCSELKLPVCWLTTVSKLLTWTETTVLLHLCCGSKNGLLHSNVTPLL